MNCLIDVSHIYFVICDFNLWSSVFLSIRIILWTMVTWILMVLRNLDLVGRNCVFIVHLRKLLLEIVNSFLLQVTNTLKSFSSFNSFIEFSIFSIDLIYKIHIFMLKHIYSFSIYCQFLIKFLTRKSLVLKSKLHWPYLFLQLINLNN